MKRFLQQTIISSLLGLCLHAANAGEPEPGELANQPGYLNLDQLQGIAGRQPSVEVTLTGPVLKMLLKLPAQINEDDPDAAQALELLKVIDQILVRVYPMDLDEAEDMLAFINDTSAVLEGQSWERIVRVREDDDSNVDIHVKLSEDGENLNGLTIMAMEIDEDRGPDDQERLNDDDDNEVEVVFVNIVGNFNPAYLANIGEQLDIGYLGDLDEDAVSGATTP